MQAMIARDMASNLILHEVHQPDKYITVIKIYCKQTAARLLLSFDYCFMGPSLHILVLLFFHSQERDKNNRKHCGRRASRSFMKKVHKVWIQSINYMTSYSI